MQGLGGRRTHRSNNVFGNIRSWAPTSGLGGGLQSVDVGEQYPVYAASALAANSFARSYFAAAFPLFVSGREGAPFAKERSLMWSRSRLPVGNDCARVPGSSNGTVRKQYPAQWSWEALMYMTQVSYLVFSIR
ncbi:hypothetical protein GGP41_006757 [Bipolaris sorokiniana]|uniref:Uncharacterized protein n=1 Tax=Cochliobolus sativus TaxID=45130 RepID=A0A8H5ZRP7_COCSA|nr:hypothetical protein GGP41_006757 [Bipolaris sorokiniana]